MRESLRSQVIASGYLAGWKLVRALPQPVAKALFNAGADIASKRGRGMPQLRKNLARVVGQRNVTDELVRNSVRSYARYWMEAFRLPSLVDSSDDLAQTMRVLNRHVEGKQHLMASVEAGNGVILVLPHSGNWDMAGVYLVNTAGSFTTVAERLKPEKLYEAFVDFREHLGFEVLPLTGGASRPFDVLQDRLRQGNTICLLGERDLRTSGMEVEFFGETTRMPVGAVRLAQETGAALHVVHCWFEDDGWGNSISPPIKVNERSTAEILQEVATTMETGIKAHPEDWHMLQPLWISDLDPKRYARTLEREQKDQAAREAQIAQAAPDQVTERQPASGSHNQPSVDRSAGDNSDHADSTRGNEGGES